MQTRKFRFPIVAILLAAVLSIPAPLQAGGNIIGPIYGTNQATTVTFPLVTASSATQALYSGATFPAGECKISKDGAAFSNCTNTPSEVAAASGVYRLALTSTEMNATGGDIAIKISKGSAYEDVVILVKTAVVLETLTLVSDRNVPLTVESTDTDYTHAAIYVNRGGATNGGDAIFINSSDCGTGTCDGIRVTAGDAGNGISATGGVGAGAGLLVQGGAGGPGISTAAGTGNASGIVSVGQGTGQGWLVQGGATGNGILAQGGSSSGSGIYAQSQGGNSIGLRVLGFGTGAGASITGGSSTSTGLAITGNTGATITSAAANGIGLSITGTGTGTGLKAVSATGYGMELSGGTGLYAAGGTHGIQGNPDIYPVTLGTSVWAEVSGTEPTTGPTWGASTYGQFLSMLTARFYNKVTQTATTQSIYKTGGVTVMATGTVSDDGVTQTKGEQR